ncbi:uncharacterized protein PAC_13406 [Phialocephala subalpina]|uniref:Uncharacterized protein n=1 Tax=Phialocephala subalpina TaxID=576137 RepID=A0A1L7XEN8_9HELO|nr:uncharacterized protein PAC_13406 [Phialocephala subalpina]
MVSNEKLCASLAGPFRNIHNENTASNLWFLFFFASIAITAFIRFLVLGYCLHWDLGPSKTDQPVPTPCPRCEHIDEALLPLSPPPPTSESNSISNPKPCREEIEAEDKRRMAVIPSIPRFALCTALAILNLLTMVLLAFAIQSFVYCSPELTSGTLIANRHQNFYAVTSWIIYVFLAGWVLSGILCWAMWARNLWGGEDAVKKWPIRSDLGAIILVCACITLAAPFMLVAIAISWVVRCSPKRRLNSQADEPAPHTLPQPLGENGGGGSDENASELERDMQLASEEQEKSSAPAPGSL